MLAETFASLIDRTAAAIGQVYGDRLVSVVLYGSVGRGTMRHDSDVALLIIAQDLPRGRMNRVTEFEAVEAAVAGEVEQARRQGVHTELSPILKTPEEAMAGSPLFLDMIDDARILYDRDGFFCPAACVATRGTCSIGGQTAVAGQHLVLGSQTGFSAWRGVRTVTNESLARSYLKKASDRPDVLDLLLNKGAYSDVVRARKVRSFSSSL